MNNLERERHNVLILIQVRVHVNPVLNNEQDVLCTGSLERALTSLFRNSVPNRTPIFSVLFGATFGLTDIDLFGARQHLFGTVYPHNRQVNDDSQNKAKWSKQINSLV